jgi:hypothetical protein
MEEGPVAKMASYDGVVDGIEGDHVAANVPASVDDLVDLEDDDGPSDEDPDRIYV